MVTKSLIDDFLSSKKMAVAGVSRDSKKFGYRVFNGLINRGYEICPINPHADLINHIKCYSSVNELPEDIDRILVVTPKERTLEVVKQAYEKGINKIWIQNQSENNKVMAFAKENNIGVICKQCIFMFTEPVEGGHKFHRTIKKIFGSYPKN